MKFNQMVRVGWIDAKLSDGGTLRRKDIMAAFGLSVAQASTDMRAYGGLASWHLQYDRSFKFFTCDKPVFSAAFRQHMLDTVAAVQSETKAMEAKS